MADKYTENSSSSWADIIKKVVYGGINSAAFAKKMVTDGEAKKEIMSMLMSLAEKKKDDFLEVLAKEVSKFLTKLNVSEEISKALKGLIINLDASIDFQEKNGSGVNPKTTIRKAKVTKKKK